jgi:hypothetical protein
MLSRRDLSSSTLSGKAMRRATTRKVAWDIGEMPLTQKITILLTITQTSQLVNPLIFGIKALIFL